MKQGIVGRTIAQRLAELGYTVIMGTRSVKETLAREIDYGTGAFSFSTWRDRHQERIILHSIAEAASGDKIICNCRKGLPWVAALECAGSANLRAPTRWTSLAERLQRWDLQHGFAGRTDSADVSRSEGGEDAQYDEWCTDGESGFAFGKPYGFCQLQRFVGEGYGKSTFGSLWLEAEKHRRFGRHKSGAGTEHLLPIWIRFYGLLKNPMFNFRLVIGGEESAND